MKRLVSVFFLCFSTFYAMGQYGSEWIQVHQPYYKISVGSDGFYSVSYEALLQAGFEVSADPQTFQLFHRGIEQAIIVQGEEDGVFNASDYIEFYGRANDGTLDATLYEHPDHQPHRFYNLYSDTTSYFLTYGLQAGKRIPTYSAPPATGDPEPYHQAEKIMILKQSYSGGKDHGNVQKTVFDQGEGWMGVQILQNQTVTYTLEGIDEIFTSSGKPQIEVLLTGRGSMNHSVELSTATRLLSALTFSGYESYLHAQEIEWSDIDANGKLSVKVRVTGIGGADRVSAGYIRLFFPQKVTMAGVAEKLFLIPEDPGGTSRLEIENPPDGARLFDVTDPSGVLYIQGDLTTTLNAVVPSSSAVTKILATSQVHAPGQIKRVVFRDIDPASHNYVFITHPVLRSPAIGYIDPVKAYAEYRALPEGGGFDTLIVNIDLLYDQFNYGEPSPRAIFQFMKFLASVQLPDYLFLIGKGLDVNYGFHRNPSAFTLYKDLVPSAGYPASDMAFTAGLSGIPHVPAVATGRLTANNSADVAAYLNKVKERDALPFDNLDRKKILHLSGGIEEYEPVLFRDIMKGFEAVAEDLYLGGRVQAIAKQSTDIKLVNIAEEVNQGLGLITFFGHSAPNTLDFDIGLVTDPVMGYNNTGKYPLLLMNGCDAGSFFLNASIIGENWIKTPDKGAIGYIAHSSYGLVSGLQRYSSTFYNVAYGDSVFIKEGVGKVQQEVAKRYVENFGSSPPAVSQLQQMVLLGDPAVKLFGAEKPDYAIDGDQIFVDSFNDEPITALTDSFRIHIPVRNLGIAEDGPVAVEISRQYSEGLVLPYDAVFPAVLFTDTLTVVIRNSDRNGFGMNGFTIHIDADNRVDELSETNNTANFEYFIPLNSTRNLFPYNYGIVKTRQVDLSFQHTDLHAAPRDYLLEIDTASTFDSGFRKQFQIVAQVLGKQHVELLESDSLVYYWRTKIAQPLENESKNWTLSSFAYIDNGPEGWAQLHFPQYENNESFGLVKDPVLRRMGFQETVSDIAVKTFSSASGKPRDSVSFRINGVEFNLMHEGGACRNNTLNLIAFDRRSTQPYAGLYFKWYELLYEYGGRRLLCGREPYVINSFTPQELITGNQDDLGQYVDNIQPGDSVVLFNIGDAGYSQWPVAARVKLEELGISTAQLADVQDGEPVIIFGRKGAAPGTASVFHGLSPQTFLKIDKTIAGRFTSGAMSSVLIGPARQWDQLIVQVGDVEASDDFSFSILGIRRDGDLDTLKIDIREREDLSWISAEAYPNLKIVLNTSDDIDLTSVQLRKWMVIYETVAEGLVFYRGPALQQTVSEGQAFSADYGFVNISDKSFSDSLVVRYDLLNHASQGNTASTIRISSPLPGDTTLFSVSFNTVSKAGLNDVEVFVNPDLESEKFYGNNWIVLDEHLDVLADRSHPVLDVTFDGRYLENNDFVPANPVIFIRLWDENSFMEMKDTLGVRIFLAYPCGSDDCEYQAIYFSRNDITWTPGSEISDFTVNFSPRDLASGTYFLRIEARDATGNSSGETPYEIAFRVEHESSIQVLSPYPNPFYSETGFEVIVTGEQAVPSFYTLQLTSLDGRLVSELSDNTTGLHVGTNRILWDGSGNDGQPLPNGIYFYHLLLTDDGAVSEYYGKVVLVR